MRGAGPGAGRGRNPGADGERGPRGAEPPTAGREPPTAGREPAGRGGSRGPVPGSTSGRTPSPRSSGPRDTGPASPRPPRSAGGANVRPRPDGEILDEDRRLPAGGGASRGGGLSSMRSGDLRRWLGGLSLLVAVLVLAGATLVGVILTLIAGEEPGALLGVFVILGSVAAVLGVRRHVIYLLFPLPALAFFIGAVLTGLVHDSQLTSSTAGLGAVFAQWLAGIFFPMVVATILVLLIGGGRWVFGSQLVTGHAVLAGGPGAAPGGTRTGPAARRPARSETWAADDPFAGRAPGTGPVPRSGTGPAPRPDTGPTPRPGTGPTPRPGTGPVPRPATGPTPRQGTGPVPRPATGPTPRPGNAGRPGPDGARPARPPRDQRADRDPWGDPRLPGQGQPPAGPRSRPAGPASQPQPRDRSPRPQPGPSFKPAAKPPPASPPRPPRRPPPEGWNQR